MDTKDSQASDLTPAEQPSEEVVKVELSPEAALRAKVVELMGHVILDAGDKIIHISNNALQVLHDLREMVAEDLAKI